MRDWPEPDQDTWLEMLDMPEPDEYSLEYSLDEEDVSIDIRHEFDDYVYDDSNYTEYDEYEYSESQLRTAELQYEEYLMQSDLHTQQRIQISEIEKHKHKIEEHKTKINLLAQQWMIDLINCGIELYHGSHEYKVIFKRAILRFAKEREFQVCRKCSEFELFCPTCSTCIRCNNFSEQGEEIENHLIHPKCRVDICKRCDFILPSSWDRCFNCDNTDTFNNICYITIHLNPDNAEIYNNWGNNSCQYSLYKEAINYFDTAIRLKADYLLAYHNRGNAKAKLGQYKDAINDYDAAIRLKPDYVLAYHNRGTINAKLGDFDAAITDYDTAIELEPNCAELYHSRALVKSKLRQFDAAIRDYDMAICLEIGSKAGTYINRGEAKAELGRYAEAISDYDTAIQYSKNNAAAYLNRGILKARLGQYKDAISDYDTAIQFRQNNALAYGYRGLAKAILGQCLIDEREYVSTSEKQYLPFGFGGTYAVLPVQPDKDNRVAKSKPDLFTQAEQDMLTALKLTKRTDSQDIVITERLLNEITVLQLEDIPQG